MPSVGLGSSEKPEKKLTPIEEMFYLDRIDQLTVQRDYWKERYELDIEEAPVIEDKGFPWLGFVVAFAAGYIVAAVID